MGTGSTGLRSRSRDDGPGTGWPAQRRRASCPIERSSSRSSIELHTRTVSPLPSASYAFSASHIKWEALRQNRHEQVDHATYLRIGVPTSNPGYTSFHHNHLTLCTPQQSYADRYDRAGRLVDDWLHVEGWARGEDNQHGECPMAVVMQEAAKQWEATLEDVRTEVAERQAAETRAAEEQVATGRGKEVANGLAVGQEAAAEAVIEEKDPAREAAEKKIADKEASELGSTEEEARKSQAADMDCHNQYTAKEGAGEKTLAKHQLAGNEEADNEAIEMNAAESGAVEQEPSEKHASPGETAEWDVAKTEMAQEEATNKLAADIRARQG